MMNSNDNQLSMRRQREVTRLSRNIGKMVREGRRTKHITQATLAKLLDTEQPSIARLEKGTALPSLLYLQRIAEVFNTRLLAPQFEFMTQRKDTALSIKVVYVYRDGKHRPYSPRLNDSQIEDSYTRYFKKKEHQYVAS